MCVEFLHEKMFLNTMKRVVRFYVNLNEASSRGESTNSDNFQIVMEIW